MKSKGFIKSVLREIDACSQQVGNTIEATGAMFTLVNAKKKMIISEFGMHEDTAKAFMDMVKGITFENVFGYISHEYQAQYDAVDMRIIPAITKDPDTRRAVLLFEATHCFQTIQFLKRGKEMKVICFMRSCDIERKLPFDMLFLTMLGKKAAKALDCKMVTLSIAFGSLHRYIDSKSCEPCSCGHE